MGAPDETKQKHIAGFSVGKNKTKMFKVYVREDAFIVKAKRNVQLLKTMTMPFKMRWETKRYVNMGGGGGGRWYFQGTLLELWFC